MEFFRVFYVGTSFGALLVVAGGFHNYHLFYHSIYYHFFIRTSEMILFSSHGSVKNNIILSSTFITLFYTKPSIYSL